MCFFFGFPTGNGQPHYKKKNLVKSWNTSRLPVARWLLEIRKKNTSPQLSRVFSVDCPMFCSTSPMFPPCSAVLPLCSAVLSVGLVKGSSNVPLPCPSALRGLPVPCACANALCQRPAPLLCAYSDFYKAHFRSVKIRVFASPPASAGRNVSVIFSYSVRGSKNVKNPPRPPSSMLERLHLCRICS